MSEEKKSDDTSAVGKAIESIPAEGWKKLINAATKTFEDLLAPITATTSGIGLLLRADFDNMADIQKFYAAEALNRAYKKLENSPDNEGIVPKSKILLAALKSASKESSETLRDIWANLIANELRTGEVHPEFPGILERISSKDAMLIITLSNKGKKYSLIGEIALLLGGLGSLIPVASKWAGDIPKIANGDIKTQEEYAANIEHLMNLGIVCGNAMERSLSLTNFGEAFLKAVSDPTNNDSKNVNQ